MYSLRLSAEQIEIRDTVREFVLREVRPLAVDPKRLEPFAKPLLTGVLAEASKLGLRTLAVSEARGGAGADSLTGCIIAEELAVGDPDVAAVLAETAVLGAMLERSMTERQRDRVLPAFMSDEYFHLAFAEREPGSETALGANYHRPAQTASVTNTTAVRKGDSWVLNGTKVAVANAPVAKLFVVVAGTATGPGAFLVPRDTAGLTVDEQQGHWYHGSCGSVRLADCRIRADDALGAEGDGALMGNAGCANPARAAVSLGIGRAAYEAALEYAQLRVQGGRRIIEHQAIGIKLANMASRLDLARTAVWRAAWASDHPEAVADRSLPDLPLTTIARIHVSETAVAVAKEAAEIFGAMGVMRDMPLQKYVQDARVGLHSGDGMTDARLRLAEVLSGHRRAAA